MGAKLGMNADQSAVAFEVTNFVLLAIGVGWMVLKMAPKMIRDRNTTIQKELVDARTIVRFAQLVAQRRQFGVGAFKLDFESGAPTLLLRHAVFERSAALAK